MESRKITYTVANLNSGVVYAQDIRTIIPGTVSLSINTSKATSNPVDKTGNYNIGSNVYGQDTIYRRPTTMMLTNQTGADFEFNLISDNNELANYSGYPQNYDRIKVKNNASLTISPMPKSQYILGYTSGIVSSNLDIFFWGYV